MAAAASHAAAEDGGPTIQPQVEERAAGPAGAYPERRTVCSDRGDPHVAVRAITFGGKWHGFFSAIWLDRGDEGGRTFLPGDQWPDIDRMRAWAPPIIAVNRLPVSRWLAGVGGRGHR